MKNYKIRISLMFGLIAALLVGTGLIHFDNLRQSSSSVQIENTQNIA